MKKEAEATGRTVEDAIASACKALGAERDKVDIEVLSLPAKRLLGLLGSTQARVRAVVRETAEDRAKTYLNGLLERMGLKGFSLQTARDKEDLKIEIEGENLGLIIGHRGETLDTLQYLVSLAANRGEEHFLKITLDTGHYREKREKTLSMLAKRLALTAAQKRRTSTLEPMNPYERRIIHTAVQQIEGAASWSVGVEPNRRVVIGPQKPKNAT